MKIILCKESELQLSKNLYYEKLYIVYRTIYDTQVQRINLKAIEKDKVTGTRKAGDRENTLILWNGCKEKEEWIFEINLKIVLYNLH